MRKEIKDIKKEQNELLKMKNIPPKVMNIPDGINIQIRYCKRNYH